MKSTTTNSRRDFLKMSAITGGGLVLGFNWFSAEASAPVVFSSIVAGDINFNSYLSIASNGAITIMSPNPELGQNIITSFPMVVAEELEADWKMVKVLQANLDNKFDRQLTGGSGAVPHSWKLLRNAGATAKFMLIEAAAQKWAVPASECTAANSFVNHSRSGKKLGFGELAEAASKIPVPATVKLKDRKDFKLIGKSVRNVENLKIVTGKPLFGLDFYRQGMVFAMIQRPEQFGMKLKSFDGSIAKSMPGIIDVVSFKNNVAVVGKSTWQVLKARKMLKIEYEKEFALESTEDHDKLFLNLMDNGQATVRRKDGDVDAAFKNAAKVIKGEYQCPFISHSPMEPMNFFAHVRPDEIGRASCRERVSELV
jgi:isoquinoline 1-oxidoreductase beta subunit